VSERIVTWLEHPPKTLRGKMAQLVVERKALLEYLGDDTQLLQEVIGIFLADSPGMLAAIRSAVTAHSPIDIMKAAHALKGSLGVFGAENAVATAQKLESMGRDGNIDGSVDTLSILEREMLLVTSALDEIAKASA
jgi:two-component system, sensor histidine kinase and response regulator